MRRSPRRCRRLGRVQAANTRGQAVQFPPGRARAASSVVRPSALRRLRPSRVPAGDVQGAIRRAGPGHHERRGRPLPHEDLLPARQHGLAGRQLEAWPAGVIDELVHMSRPGASRDTAMSEPTPKPSIGAAAAFTSRAISSSLSPPLAKICTRWSPASSSMAPRRDGKVPPDFLNPDAPR